ncbi:MAG: hypothetical protein KDK37_18075, partial [Leptospiraceae bacterium]|nr:hypothetical protein [Leptospiraceae bacterium]
MNLNDITFLPARLSTGYRDKAGWPPGKLLLQTIGLTLIFLVATGGWIWLVFKALNLFTGPFVSSVSLLTVGAPFFAALPSFLYAFLCFWLAARSDGKKLSQLQGGWLLKASAIIGVAGASLGFIIAVLALPQ